MNQGVLDQRYLYFHEAKRSKGSQNIRHFIETIKLINELTGEKFFLLLKATCPFVCPSVRLSDILVIHA